MTFDKLTLKAQEAVAKAQQIASEHGHQQIEVEHLLKALIEDSEGVPGAILKKLGANEGLVLSRLDEEIQKIPKVSGLVRSVTFTFQTDLIQFSMPRCKRCGSSKMNILVPSIC